MVLYTNNKLILKLEKIIIIQKKRIYLYIYTKHGRSNSKKKYTIKDSLNYNLRKIIAANLLLNLTQSKLANTAEKRPNY